MLEGIFPVLPTPFLADGAIDRVAMARITAFAMASGAHGVVFPGFASEVDNLDAQERLTLLGVVVATIGGRIPVIAGASSGSVAESVARCREALALGISTVMIQAPKSVGATTEAVSAFYRDIAAQVPGIAIVLQNAPAPRGSDLSPETILRIARENPAIRYVKEETLPSGPAITALVAGKPAHVLGIMGGGGARYILDELARGACGAMPAAEITDVHVALYDAWRAGNVAQARALYSRTLPLLLIQAFSRMRFTKHVLTLRGICSNDVVRAAIPPLDAVDRAEIAAWLATIDDLLTVAPLQRAA